VDAEVVQVIVLRPFIVQVRLPSKKHKMPETDTFASLGKI